MASASASAGGDTAALATPPSPGEEGRESGSSPAETRGVKRAAENGEAFVGAEEIAASATSSRKGDAPKEGAGASAHRKRVRFSDGVPPGARAGAGVNDGASRDDDPLDADYAASEAGGGGGVQQDQDDMLDDMAHFERAINEAGRAQRDEEEWAEAEDRREEDVQREFEVRVAWVRERAGAAVHSVGEGATRSVKEEQRDGQGAVVETDGEESSSDEVDLMKDWFASGDDNAVGERAR